MKQNNNFNAITLLETIGNSKYVVHASHMSSSKARYLVT